MTPEAQIIEALARAHVPAGENPEQPVMCGLYPERVPTWRMFIPESARGLAALASMPEAVVLEALRTARFKEVRHAA